jgi:hypothetical protein
MANFYTVNKMVAIKPITNDGIKATVIGGVAMISQGSDVIITEVIFDSVMDDEVVMKGSKVMLPGDSAVRSWNNKRFKHNDEYFVLVPQGEILMLSPPEDA